MHRYHPVSISLHWLTVLGLLAATAMALIMVDMPGITPAKLRLFNYHKWLGVCLLLLVVVRLLARLVWPAPALPASIPVWQQQVARGLHLGLYLLLLLIPVIGYCYSLAAGFPVVLFGVWPLPVFMAPDPELKAVLKTAHQWANKALWIVLALHVSAALKHAFIDRDGVMQRMWFRFSRKDAVHP